MRGITCLESVTVDCDDVLRAFTCSSVVSTARRIYAVSHQEGVSDGCGGRTVHAISTTAVLPNCCFRPTNASRVRLDEAWTPANSTAMRVVRVRAIALPRTAFIGLPAVACAQRQRK